MNKARRGALKLHLPIGLCYTQTDQVILDPHQQVQKTIYFLFRTFQQAGSASAVVRIFQQQQVAFPRRVRSGGARYNDSNWCLFVMQETRPVEPE